MATGATKAQINPASIDIQHLLERERNEQEYLQIVQGLGKIFKQTSKEALV